MDVHEVTCDRSPLRLSTLLLAELMRFAFDIEEELQQSLNVRGRGCPRCKKPSKINHFVFVPFGVVVVSLHVSLCAA